MYSSRVCFTSPYERSMPIIDDLLRQCGKWLLNHKLSANEKEQGGLATNKPLGKKYHVLKHRYTKRLCHRSLTDIPPKTTTKSQQARMHQELTVLGFTHHSPNIVSSTQSIAFDHLLATISSVVHASEQPCFNAGLQGTRLIRR